MLLLPGRADGSAGAGYLNIVLEFTNEFTSAASVKKMAIQDSVTSWFIQNIVLPNAEDMRNPGYILSRFTDQGKTIALREFFFPERFYIELEIRIAKDLGAKGEKLLYSIGKRFGYRYAGLSRYPIADSVGEKKLDEFMYMFTRYIEVIYARQLKHRIDFKSRLLELEADSYVCCAKDGMGYLLLIGPWTGGWAHIMGDSSIEGIQIACQGRGDKRCRLFCAPAPVLKGMKLKPPAEPDMYDLGEDMGKYGQLNAVYPSENGNGSMVALIENGIFRYERGQLFFGDKRMVGIESSMQYMIDDCLSRSAKTRKILFDTAFSAGKDMGKGREAAFAQRLLSGIGFGDAQVVSVKGGYKVMLFHFPWTAFSKDCRFTTLAGFVSGLLSGVHGKDIILKKVSKTEAENGFHVQLD
jgi:hypothetical protein